MLDLEIWVSLATLTALEVVLGIDNLVFIAILSQRVAKHQEAIARQGGLFFAAITRLLLLAAANWASHLNQTWFTLLAQNFSIRDVLFIGGGLFLIVKGTNEIHATFAEQHEKKIKLRRSKKIGLIILQIMLFDILFSLDSVITAVGMTQNFSIMATAIIIAVLTMLFASRLLSQLISQYPSLKTLALSFLVLVGMVLIADGFDFHLPRGYIYFAIIFSLTVEIINILLKQRSRE